MHTYSYERNVSVPFLHTESTWYWVSRSPSDSTNNHSSIHVCDMTRIHVRVYISSSRCSCYQKDFLFHLYESTWNWESCHTYKRVMPHVYTRNCCTRMCLTSDSIFFKKSETRHSHMNEPCHTECLFVISERLLVLFIYRVYVKLRFSDFRADLLLALISAVTHWYVRCSTL